MLSIYVYTVAYSCNEREKSFDVMYENSNELKFKYVLLIRQKINFKQQSKNIIDYWIIVVCVGIYIVHRYNFTDYCNTFFKASTILYQNP